MRHSWARILVTGAMAATLGLVGCGEQQTTGTTQNDGAPTTTVTTNDAGTGTVTNQEQINEEEAKRVAFSDAGVSEQDISLLTVHLDNDDTTPKYEVDFNVGTTEYDYEIDALSGDIIERNVDAND